MITFKEVHCLLPTKEGVCNRYLCDIQANTETTIRLPCRNKHIGSNRIEFSQDKNGIVSWRQLPENEKKSYDDDNIRIEK